MIARAFFFPSFQSRSRLAISWHFSGEQKCSPHKGHPSQAARHSAALRSPSEAAHKGLFQGTLGLGEARYLPSYQAIAIHQTCDQDEEENARGRGNKGREVFYPKATTKEKRDPWPSELMGKHQACLHAGNYWAGIALKKVPSFIHPTRDYSSRLWPGGCLAGEERGR